MLQDSEGRYQLLEKVALSLVHTARRLQQYFHSHKIIVRTDCPIAKVLRKPELAGCMMAWSIKLSEFDISFEPRGPIKSQCLVDFINELQPVSHFESNQWTIRVDGSSNNQGSGAGIILEGPTGLALEQSLHFAFKAYNNQAEYEALLVGLRLAREVSVQKLICWTDSKVVSEQVNENFQVKDAHFLKYYHTFRNMCRYFDEVVVKHTPRENNERADQLARLATSSCKPGQLRTTLHLELSTPSVDTTDCLAIFEQPATWMTDIIRFITEGTKPTCPSAAKKLRTQAARYSVVGGELYRRGFSSPLLKCLDSEQANHVLREVHEGICGSHSGGRTLAEKTWQLNICVNRAVAQHQFALVVCPMGNGYTRSFSYCQRAVKVLADQKLNKFLQDLGIKYRFTSVEHPQENGQAEVANKVILSELKKRLGDAKGVWAEELLEVLWAYRCTPQSITQETPFRLTCGSDAMILVEVGEPSFHRAHFDEASNDMSLRAEVDMIDEARDRAQLVAEACKQRMSWRHNSNLMRREFKEGDLVWRAQGSARCNPHEGKLAANWDGPFRIRHNLQNGAYKLEELSGKIIPRTWNSTHLKMYFS
ncbi:uncharacterized protein LOC109799532 [Cajanus cajan]|uniref:uncharacterized protein LOC109799532 n=1 Tax=Cajanus cajan TaxID=3821 RepID=UPI00098DC4D4|nr:uncharacterized protein LOC109799532 [Cajanus cajan]